MTEHASPHSPPGRGSSPLATRRSAPSRILLWIAATGAILTLLALAGAWPEIRVRFYLARLDGSPSLLETYLLDGECRSEAARRFVWTERGGRELFRLYIQEFDRTDPPTRVLDGLFRGRSTDKPQHGILLLRPLAIGEKIFGETSGFRGGHMGLPPENARRRMSVLALLDACSGNLYRLEELPGFEFLIRGRKEGSVAPGEHWRRKTGRRGNWWWDMERRLGEDAEHLCYFRRLHEDEVP